MEHELMFVEGSPDSEDVQTFPTDREMARRFRASGRRPYCSAMLGGCGQLLTTVVGTKVTPHLRHRAGSSCSLRGDADRYTHLWMQHQVAQWCRNQGAEQVRLEVSVERGRSDVRCIFQGTVYSIEVQRSPILHEEIDRRTALYACDGAVVVWLLSARVCPNPAPFRPLLLTHTITEAGLRLRLCDSHGFQSPEFFLDECTLHADQGVSRPVWSAGAIRRTEIQVLINEWRCQLEDERRRQEQARRAAHQRMVDLRKAKAQGLWEEEQQAEQDKKHRREQEAEQSWKQLQQEVSNRPRLYGTRTPAKAKPLLKGYDLVRSLMNTSASIRAGRPLDKGGKPICLVCGVKVSAEYAVHPADWNCAGEWLRRRDSVLWAANAEYVRDRMPQR